MRRLSLTLCICFAAVLGLSRPGNAQEDDGEPTLRLSMYQCHVDRIDAAMAQVDSLTLPIWQELVDEGMATSMGTFVHDWGDEWNVGIYTVAESIQAVIEFSQEAAERFQERHPDAPDLFGEACPKHRDGFYVFGPRTGQDQGEDAGEGGGG